MNDRELLLYIYGYLNGVLNMSKISSNKILKLKEIISLQQERNKINLQAQIEDDDEDDESENEYGEFGYEYNKYDNNDRYYNENLDLDQQDPDFYC